MPKVTIDMPESFQYKTELSIRFNDVNYGGHLGNDSVLSLMQEARIRFLADLGYGEKDLEGSGIIMRDAVILFKSEGFYGDRLFIEIAAGNMGGAGCDFFYRLSNAETGRDVALAKTGVGFFDYKNKKIVKMPGAFRAKIAALTERD